MGHTATVLVLHFCPAKGNAGGSPSDPLWALQREESLGLGGSHNSVCSHLLAPPAQGGEI